MRLNNWFFISTSIDTSGERIFFPPLPSTKTAVSSTTGVVLLLSDIYEPGQLDIGIVCLCASHRLPTYQGRHHTFVNIMFCSINQSLTSCSPYSQLSESKCLTSSGEWAVLRRRRAGPDGILRVNFKNYKVDSEPLRVHKPHYSTLKPRSPMTADRPVL